MRLPAQAAGDGIAADEALLDQVQHTRRAAARWWIPSRPAVVVGLGLQHRRGEVVDAERCAAGGLPILDRRAGGGALLLDAEMICGAVCLPLPDGRVDGDITDSYRWLGDALVSALHAVGISGARRVDVAEAREDVAALRLRTDAVAHLVLNTCYGALSPHEVALGSAKLVGIAQVRRRRAALYQFGILLRDQAPLVDYLVTPDVSSRRALIDELRQRTVGVSLEGRAAAAVAEAVAAATPGEA